MKPANNPTILALGADIKSRFCIFKDGEFIFSPEFGDLSSLDNFKSFKKSLLNLKIIPNVIAFDMHPGYFSSSLAGLLKAKKKIAVQHHHAHIASALAQNKITNPVIGVAFDGTGYGSDGNIWGGEFMIVDKGNFRRQAHFKYLNMPGAELAVNEPLRMAFSIIYDCLKDEIFKQDLEFLKLKSRSYFEVLIKMIKQNINSPLTSSAGRLFDAVSSILGICHKINFPAQAAIELEKLAAQSTDDSSYEFDISEEENGWIIGYNKLIKAMLNDINNRLAKKDIARRFHNGLAEVIKKVVDKISQRYNWKDVVLSGGVFGNKLLFDCASKELKRAGYNLIYNKDVPLNDSGICLGQSYITLNSK
ncbi:MAG: hypothetical protein PHS93_04925 [Candidatus Omnitrophica bacterium]|nr:hypothetical protein [Candidatus Omnitrophota bacterium]MDD5352495.1 hypothetical protein [Candidatus Omnitrophota bacterium]MDD5550093.1 hypothetical protein [Candidatus Omnitrophota bacterium]